MANVKEYMDSEMIGIKLEEEKETDAKLTELAESEVNDEAASGTRAGK